MLQIGRSLVRFQMVSLEFFIDITLPIHYGPGVDSASNRNEYQEYFLGQRRPVRKDDNLTTRRWDVGIWTGFGWPRIETGGGRL